MSVSALPPTHAYQDLSRSVLSSEIRPLSLEGSERRLRPPSRAKPRHRISRVKVEKKAALFPQGRLASAYPAYGTIARVDESRVRNRKSRRIKWVGATFSQAREQHSRELLESVLSFDSWDAAAGSLIPLASIRRGGCKKRSNLDKMLRAHTRQKSDLETMKELINTIVQKTGISQEDAQKTVQVVLGFLKTKMPAPFAAQLDSFLSGSGLPQQTGDFLKSKVGEVVGAKA